MEYRVIREGLPVHHVMSPMGGSDVMLSSDSIKGVQTNENTSPVQRAWGLVLHAGVYCLVAGFAGCVVLALDFHPIVALLGAFGVVVVGVIRAEGGLVRDSPIELERYRIDSVQLIIEQKLHNEHELRKLAVEMALGVYNGRFAESAIDAAISGAAEHKQLSAGGASEGWYSEQERTDFSSSSNGR